MNIRQEYTDKQKESRQGNAPDVPRSVVGGSGFPQGSTQGAGQPFCAAPSTQPEHYKVHHSYIWLGSMRVIFALLFAIIISSAGSLGSLFSKGDIFMAGNGRIPFVFILGALVFFIVLVGLVVACQALSYKHLSYEIGPEEFTLYSGVFNKKRVHVPYWRIQSVDQRASLFQRIFGVCSVHIDTAGGASNKAIAVPYLQKEQAEILRAELFARKQYVLALKQGVEPEAARAALVAATRSTAPNAYPQGANVAVGSHEGNVLDAPAEVWQDVRGVFGGLEIDTGQISYEYGMSNKELILTGISNNSTFVVVVIGLFATVAQFIFDAFEPAVDSVVASGVHLFGGNFIGAMAVGIALIMIVIWIFSAIGSCISYGGFRACRRNSRIEVEHGLLQHRFQGVDVDRVQSVVIKQSFVRRLMGYCELSLGKIDAAADKSDQQKSSLETRGFIIHPFVKMSRVPEILAGVIPEFAGVPLEVVPVAGVALRRALIRRCIIQGVGFWLAVVTAVTHLIVYGALLPSLALSARSIIVPYVSVGFPIAYAFCVILLILDAVGAVLWFRGSSFAFNDHFVQVTNGGFARETVSVPRKKIQFGYTKTNPFQRRAQTATINVRTAAGVGGTTIRLIDAREQDALTWLAWLKPRR